MFTFVPTPFSKENGAETGVKWNRILAAIFPYHFSKDKGNPFSILFLAGKMGRKKYLFLHIFPTQFVDSLVNFIHTIFPAQFVDSLVNFFHTIFPSQFVDSLVNFFHTIFPTQFIDSLVNFIQTIFQNIY